MTWLPGETKNLLKSSWLIRRSARQTLVLDDRECRAEREILRCWLRGTGNGADSGGRQARIRLSS
jgi:hypothetical protein